MAHPEFTCSVRVQYLRDQSKAPEGPFTFAYTVTIRNTGDVTAQLVARRWLLSDAAGHIEEIRGLAVVGQQPVLKPGEQHEYTSHVRIDSAQGTMQGTYFCMTEDARPFEAAVPLFVLARPEALH